MYIDLHVYADVFIYNIYLCVNIYKDLLAKVQTWNGKGHGAPLFSSVFFSEAAHQNYSRK